MHPNILAKKFVPTPFCSLLLILPLAGLLPAHPMGNFSVNHYARFDFEAQRTQLTYVLDLAEIPTLELLQQLKIPAENGTQLQSAVAAQAREWLTQLHVTENGAPVPIRLQKVTAHIMEGAGGLQILRVDMEAQLPSHPGTLDYQDGNYAERTGWKEIVVNAGSGASISQSTQGSGDRSHALSIYPPNEIAAPPQDLHSAVTWSAIPVAPPAVQRSAVPVAAHPSSVPIAATLAAIPAAAAPVAAPPAVAPTAIATAPAPEAAKSFTQQQPQPMGTLVTGDYLSRMLRTRKIPFRLALIGVLFAFCLGAMHAFSPGHGKTIVAAYLVGTRGTLKHALFLGSMVTFTHTISVFALGLGVLFFQQYIVPDQIIPILGALSGLSIVAIGLLLMYQRTKALAEGGHHPEHSHARDHNHALVHDHNHAHGHDHPHPHEHVHAATPVLEPVHSHAHVHAGAPEPHAHLQAQSHTHDLVHPHTHDHDHAHPHTHAHDDGHAHGLVHSHGGGKPHSHLPPDKVSIGSLVALGISGGLVPCPSALILLLSAIALGRTGLGLVLLLGFSAGLAIVLMAIGGMVIYAKRLMPEGRGLRTHPAFRYVPVFSAVVVIVLGLMMTGVSMGWITPRLAI